MELSSLFLIHKAFIYSFCLNITSCIFLHIQKQRTYRRACITAAIIEILVSILSDPLRLRASDTKRESYSHFHHHVKAFVWTLLSELLTRGQSALRSITALYCFTSSGELLHRELQTEPPGPSGGHYDRDEQLKSSVWWTAQWQQGRRGHSVGGKYKLECAEWK